MKKISFVSLLLAAGLMMLAGQSMAQQKKKAAPAKSKTGAGAAGFKKLKGIEYKIYKDVPGPVAKPGDMVEFNIFLKCDTTILGDSRSQQGGKPAAMPFSEPRTSTDWQWALSVMSAGDSAVLRVHCDSILASVPKDKLDQVPRWMKKGATIVINLDLVSVKSKEQYDAEQKEKAKVAEEQEAKDLQDYFTKNNLKPNKTETGLYYTIKEPGTGSAIVNGQTVTMNYVGKLLNGTTFDANTDSTRALPNARPPFSFQVGQHRVINGWDEGVQLLKNGAKATFYIPSKLAYGPQGNHGIPPFAPLIFDVQVTEVKDMAAEESKKLQEYFTKNNLKPNKTASGLYYIIKKEGSGDPITAGQKVTMNYIGKLLDGTSFDANMDSTCNLLPGKQPFSFTPGSHQVIAGWDEGVTLLKKGATATFFIPSNLGYGSQGNHGIPPYASLVFDVNVADVAAK
jgi:FKBP-type peptidyl-prolyl cis-trans isomerase FkpA